MSSTLLYSDRAIRQLKKLDKTHSKIIVSWLTKHIKNCDDPRAFGKPRKAHRKGQWRHRIGSYRVIVEIEDNKLIVVAAEIGH